MFIFTTYVLGKSFMKNTHLDKHIVENEEKVDDLRGHDKNVKATRRLIDTDSLYLTTILECTCTNIMLLNCWK